MAQTTASIPILTGSNFNNWKFRIATILEKEQVHQVLQNDNPAEDKMKEFLVSDAKAKAILIQGISDKHLDVVKDCKTTKAMMTALQNIFTRSSSFSKLTLWRKLVNLKCNRRDSLEDHFLKFDSLTRELEEYGSKLNESDRICHLLLSLPKEYDTLITALETQPDLKMDFVKARLLDEEAKFASSKKNPGLDSNEVSFKASSNGCYQCGDKSHYIAQCPKAFQKDQERGRPFRARSRGRTRYMSRGSNNRTKSSPKIDENVHSSEVSFIALKVDANNSVPEDRSNQFIIDSGASNHLVNKIFLNNMFDIKNLEHPIVIHIANGETMTTSTVGKLKVMCQDKLVTIQALVVSGLKHCLLSVSKLTEKGFKIVIDKNNMVITGNGCKFICDKIKGLYLLNFELVEDNEIYNVNITKPKASTNNTLWHRRLGHLNRRGLSLLGLPYSLEKCDACIQGKATRLPFSRKEKTSTQIGELIHSDVCGPVNPLSHDGMKYFQVIIDDFSQFLVVRLLMKKSEAENNLIEYIAELERQHSTKVKRLRLDNGGEVTSNNFKDFARSKGIQLQYTMAHSPQMNGKSERMNRTLLNMVRTKLFDSGIPKALWGEALRCSAYELNRSPTTTLEQGKTPALIWNGRQDISKMKIFGCTAWYTCLPKGRKLDSRANLAIMIGYCGGGYRLWVPEERKVIRHRDVIFNESKMYYKQKLIHLSEDSNQDEPVQHLAEDELCDEDEKSKEHEELDQEHEVEDQMIGESSTSQYELGEPIRLQSPVINNQGPVSNRPQRVKRKPSYLEEYDLYNAYCLLSFNNEPKNYQQAVEDEEWRAAINNELDSHSKMGTWEPAILPPNQKAIDLKWIFKIKEDGTKKARLVAKGFQQPTNNNELTYAPVCRMSTLRILLSQSVNSNWEVKQIDVPTAFLNGTVDEDIYIKKPEGVQCNQEVFKLRRALYGLRISPKCWNDKFNEVITDFGLKRSQHDCCLYFAKGVYLLLFVDDALVTGEPNKVEKLISYLQNEFKVKIMGNAKCFLGMTIIQRKNGLEVKQTKIINKLLQEYGMEECRPVSTPMEIGFQVNEAEVNPEVPYRSLVCSLMYLAVTSRPDLSFAVSVLSRVLDKPTNLTWKAAKRVLRYLNGTKDLGIVFTKQNNPELTTFSDADWGGDHTSRKSTSGYVSFHGNNPISWSSKKQTCVALSTMEAEYYAAASAAQELVNLKGVVSVFEQSNQRPVLKVDNLSAISMIKTYQNSKRGKHIEIRAHYIKDLYFKKVFDLKYVSTQENIADFFTKPLCKEKFLFCRNFAMNLPQEYQ